MRLCSNALKDDMDHTAHFHRPALGDGLCHYGALLKDDAMHILGSLFFSSIIARIATSEDVGELAQELGVTRRCLHKWRAKLETVESGGRGARARTSGTDPAA